MCAHLDAKSFHRRGFATSPTLKSPNAATEARAHAQTCAKPSLTRPSEAAQISEMSTEGLRPALLSAVERRYYPVDSGEDAADRDTADRALAQTNQHPRGGGGDQRGTGREEYDRAYDQGYGRGYDRGYNEAEQAHHGSTAAGHTAAQGDPPGTDGYDACDFESHCRRCGRDSDHDCHLDYTKIFDHYPCGPGVWQSQATYYTTAEWEDGQRSDSGSGYGEACGRCGHGYYHPKHNPSRQGHCPFVECWDADSARGDDLYGSSHSSHSRSNSRSRSRSRSRSGGSDSRSRSHSRSGGDGDSCPQCGRGYTHPAHSDVNPSCRFYEAPVHHRARWAGGTASPNPHSDWVARRS